MNEFRIIKTPDQPKNPDDFGSKEEEKREQKMAEIGFEKYFFSSLCL